VPRVDLAGTLIVLALVAGAVSTAAAHAHQAVASWIGYEQFMELSADQRRASFIVISPENKAVITQTHAQGWLQNNRGRLSASEVKVFEAIIAFITPDLYRERLDPVDERVQELAATMKCRVSPDDVRAATSVLREPVPASQNSRWTYLDQAKCWIHWMVEGVLDYVPTHQLVPAAAGQTMVRLHEHSPGTRVRSAGFKTTVHDVPGA
jgi:hypothetical protein